MFCFPAAQVNTQHETLSSLPLPGLPVSNFGNSVASATPFPNVGQQTLNTGNTGFPASKTATTGMSNLPTPMNVSNDKYGALADLLALSELDASSFSSPSSHQQQQDVISKENDFFSSTNEQTIPANPSFQTLGDFNSSNFQTNFSFGAKSETEEEDFGDFIAVPNSQSKIEGFDLSTNQMKKDGFELSNINFATFTSTAPNVNVMTWHESR